MSRAKGNRTLRKAINYYEEEGWLVDRVELGGRFRKSKDLFSTEDFGGFDLICLKPGKVKFIQVKTNSPATQGPYSDFAARYASRYVKVEGLTWYDRKGWVVHKFHKNGKVKRVDLR